MIELDEGHCRLILEEAPTAHLACVADGEPYVTPLSFVMIDGTCYLRTSEGRRLSALRQDPRVCVEVSRPTLGEGWESVVFWGEARLVDDLDTRAAVVAALIHKYREPVFSASITTVLPQEHPVIAIVPQRLSGRAAGGGFETNTRPGRL
jgi:nitroimidazol reductase NimA-like FMN-containing flavoprotein (pyridoxamine 5'-phosphate oxidase superfamily)